MDEQYCISKDNCEAEFPVAVVKEMQYFQTLLQIISLQRLL